MTANTDSFLLPDQFSISLTIGFNIIRPMYAKISMRIMGVECSHRKITRERGTSHQRLCIMKDMVLFIYHCLFGKQISYVI